MTCNLHLQPVTCNLQPANYTLRSVWTKLKYTAKITLVCSHLLIAGTSCYLNLLDFLERFEQPGVNCLLREYSFKYNFYLISPEWTTDGISFFFLPTHCFSYMGTCTYSCNINNHPLLFQLLCGILGKKTTVLSLWYNEVIHVNTSKEVCCTCYSNIMIKLTCDTLVCFQCGSAGDK